MKAFWTQARWFVLSFLPLVAPLIYYKMAVAPPNDWVAGQGHQATFQRLVDLSRYLTVVKAFVSETAAFGGGSVVMLMVFMALTGTATGRDRVYGLKMVWILLALMLAGYFFTYITTPQSLEWHLRTSLDRLLLHLWPSMVLALFLMAKIPAFGPRSDARP